MPKPSGFFRLGIRPWPLAALLIGGAILVHSLVPDRDPAASASAPTEQATDETYQNPEAIVKRFGSELGAMADRGEVTPPIDLARQVEANERCSVQTLACPEKRLDAEELYARSRRGVVIVGGITKAHKRRPWQVSCASGFVIHKDGLIVTNAHVINAFRHMTAIGIMTNDGRVFPVQSVLAADPSSDVAVLKVEAHDLTPLPIVASLPVGATVYCLSHPELDCTGNVAGFYTLTEGIVCGKFRFPAGGEKPLDWLAITADYAQGSSGGPILNHNGAVVGMVCRVMALCDQSAGGAQQMTWKLARPSASILAILRGGAGGE